MKLYIWEGEGVLSDYTNGMIVALAPDLETAFAKIAEKCDWADGAYPHAPTQIVDLDNQPASEAWLVHGGG
ncbi:MAG TPA: hypothetical protein VN663_23100 [Ramlibacter sp.]|nr:hypothetical protein [Ramlibacter sp.]